jgi:hypothetical protein
MSDSTYDLSQVIQAIDSGPALSGVNGSAVSVNSGSPTNLAVFNAGRVFLLIQNLGPTLYVKLGTGASLANYSFQLGPLQMVSLDRFNGVVSAVVATGTGNAIVTEIS